MSSILSTSTKKIIKNSFVFPAGYHHFISSLLLYKTQKCFIWFLSLCNDCFSFPLKLLIRHSPLPFHRNVASDFMLNHERIFFFLTEEIYSLFSKMIFFFLNLKGQGSATCPLLLYAGFSSLLVSSHHPSWWRLHILELPLQPETINMFGILFGKEEIVPKRRFGVMLWGGLEKWVKCESATRRW